jgi:hypothetical protein
MSNILVVGEDIRYSYIQADISGCILDSAYRMLLPNLDSTSLPPIPVLALTNLLYFSGKSQVAGIGILSLSNKK